jgi:hypothetical protein
MSGSKVKTERWRNYWDKHSESYDREMAFFDRRLFANSRDWVCSQAVGNVLEVAIGTGLNLAHLWGSKTSAHGPGLCREVVFVDKSAEDRMTGNG